MLGGNGDPKSQEILSRQGKERMPSGNTKSWISPPSSIAIGRCLIKSMNFDASSLFFLQLCLQWILVGISPIPATALRFEQETEEFQNSSHVSGIPCLPQGVSPDFMELWSRKLWGFGAEPGDSCRWHLLFLVAFSQIPLEAPFPVAEVLLESCRRSERGEMFPSGTFVTPCTLIPAHPRPLLPPSRFPREVFHIHGSGNTIHSVNLHQKQSSKTHWEKQSLLFKLCKGLVRDKRDGI